MKNTLSANLLVQLLNQYPAFRDNIRQISAIENQEKPLSVSGLKGSMPAYFINSFAEQCHLNQIHKSQYQGKAAIGLDYLVVASTSKEEAELQSDLQMILGENAEVYTLPWWGTIPYRPASKNSLVFGERASVLAKLAHRPQNAKARFFIVNQRSLLTPVPPPSYLRKQTVRLVKGMQFDPVELSNRLSQMGYMRVPRVGMKGEFALRGEVLDIFLPGEKLAHRILFEFDTIDQIKTFDAEIQSSKEKVGELVIYPMKEVVWTDDLCQSLENKLKEIDEGGISNDFALFDQKRRRGDFSKENEASVIEESVTQKTGENIHLSFTEEARKKADTLVTELSVSHASEGEELLYSLLWDKRYSVFDYISKDTPVFFVDYDRLCNAVKSLQNEFEVSYRSARQTLPALPPSFMLLDFYSLIEAHPRSVFFRSLDTLEDCISVPTEVSRSFFGNINYFKEELTALQKDGWHIFIFADNPNQALRISEVVKGFVEVEPPLEPVQVLPLPISEGFSVGEIKLLVIQENEIFGRRRNTPASTRKVSSKAIDTFVELNPGDYVVHVNYGIGLFEGIERVKAMGTERDFIKLEYADKEFVFVPIEQVNMVQRYIGSESEHPRLDRIGGKSWSSRKAKVQQKVEEMANKLIDLYSKRQASRGFPFPKDGEWQAAFEAAFPYEDTPDQFTATQDIKHDMESPVPMDRLVCGDVGYGKTEIAMRAAFKAVMGGKQVAFLAPTTILAEQHYENCIERFKNFPVTIAQLSRFVTPAEQKKILTKLAQGEVDILIGTHRILQKDVIFKDLGLMIIDEEQRFGVKDKEKLKTLKTNIDSLALSATPIPRTLHMSLLKIRDMSLLTTPPQNRQSIETVIDGYDDEKVALAIRREVDRGGQVFYLHNRVETLEETRLKLQHLLPEMLIDVAHGQMTVDELDDIFRRFKMGGFHVLVATTIIENGIDIPNVNTIIIDRADMYGVSQLYQLRGRVGRSDRKAYAYLFYPGNKALSEVAMKRLQVISDFTELGSGFKIAMKDMEIRGAGNLLGRDQSGEVCAVGFEMYLHLLNAAIERLTNSGWHETEDVLLELDYTGFIPDSYISDAQTKMELYKKIASISTEPQIAAMYAEFFDRFGPVPDEVNSLLSLAKIRVICNKIGIRSLKEYKGLVQVEFARIENVNVDKVLKLISTSAGRVKLDSKNPNVLFLQAGSIDLTSKADFIKEKLEALA